MLSTDLPEFIWGNRSEPYYAAHPTTRRLACVAKDEALARLAAGGRYFAPVPRIARGNTKADCATSFDALWCDIDRDASTDPDRIVSDIESTLRKLALWPSCIVYSGGRGVHLYWKLDSDLPVDVIERLNRTLSRELKGDEKCFDRARILRHPGTIHERSGNEARIVEFTGEVHAVSSLPEIALVQNEPRTPPAHAVAARPANSAWRAAAAELSGWGAPETLNFSVLLQWQHNYLLTRPGKGWTRPRYEMSDGRRVALPPSSRSEVEQSIVYRLVGTGAGASDAQVIAVADEAFAKHLEEKPRQGDRYIERTLERARERWFERGFITSSLGGWPRKRDVAFRVATDDDLHAELDLVCGQLESEWIKQVMGSGRSSSTAYRHRDRLIEEGQVTIDDLGRIHRAT